MYIRKASLTEVDLVRKWIVETAVWLNSRNIFQWERFLVYNATEVCLKDFYDEKLYVLLDDESNVVAAMSFGMVEDIDIKLWNEDYDDAYYIHRLVVGKEFRNKKYGLYLINWAREVCEKENKKLRLNCVEDNKYLFNYYENKGFEYCGKKLGYYLFSI